MEPNQDPNRNNPEVSDVTDAAKAFLNKKPAAVQIENLRNKLLASARRLYTNTIRINGMLDDPDMIDRLGEMTGNGKMKGYWASKMISAPLLSSSIHQLSQAYSLHDVLLAVVRLVGIVEDAEAPVQTPHKPRMKNNGKPNHHQIYHYLMKAAGWPPEKVVQFDEDLAVFTDQLVDRLADKVKGGKRLNTQPRPKGW